MSRAYNLYDRYSPEQLLDRQAKITGNPRNHAPDGAAEIYKRAPCRELEALELALDYHAIPPNTIV